MPRSLFGIVVAATAPVFIAGGIGITPILSMIHWCEANGKPWKLLYCTRARRRAAYLDRHHNLRFQGADARA
jgi:vanillate O-demethylase ferredoxin subunit